MSDDKKIIRLILDPNKLKKQDDTSAPAEKEDFVKDISIKIASNGFCVSVQYKEGSPDDVWLFGDKEELLEFLYTAFRG